MRCDAPYVYVQSTGLTYCENGCSCQFQLVEIQDSQTDEILTMMGTVQFLSVEKMGRVAAGTR